jgi:hypothetical protein
MQAGVGVCSCMGSLGEVLLTPQGPVVPAAPASHTPGHTNGLPARNLALLAATVVTAHSHMLVQVDGFGIDLRPLYALMAPSLQLELPHELSHIQPVHMRHSFTPLAVVLASHFCAG